MHHRFSFLTLVLATAIAPALPAQSASSADAQSATAADQSVLTVRRNSHLVVLDVVVTDSHSKPVTDLKAADLVVLDSKHPQNILSFEEHNPPAQPVAPVLPKLPPNTFTNYTPLPEGGVLNILLLDALNTPMKDQAYVRYQMLQFLKTMPVGSHIAVFGLSTHLRILQGFTSDPEILRAVLGGKKNLPQASVLLDNPVEGDFAGADSLDNLAYGGVSTAELGANIDNFNAEIASFQTMLRARYTLDALNDLARYLSGMPGRKNLIWFSGSFPLDILPDGDLADPFIAVADAEAEFRETSDMLVSSQVAVYPVDARGLMTPPMFSASNSGRSMGTGPGMMNALGAWSQQTAAEHETMDAMAEATGGKAFYNTNGLKQAVQKSIDMGSHYYTLSYTPANAKWQGEFRDIKVKFANLCDGCQLYYRHGYYADEPGHPGGQKNAVPVPTAMQTALLRGSPDPSQVIFEATILKTSTADAVAANGNMPADKVHGPFNTYLVACGIDAHNLNLALAPDGNRHGQVELVTLLYNAEGDVLNSISNTLNTNLQPATYADLLRHGMQIRQYISVPADPRHPKEYFLRIAVRDATTDRVGAIEVPISAIHGEPAPASR